MKHTTHLFTIILLIFLSACQHDSKNDTQLNKGEKLRILTYGGPPDLDRMNAENVVAAKWDLEFVSAAGCTVTDELVDSVRRYNKKVETLIKKKYGKSWEVTFDKEVNEELRKQKIASSLLDKEIIIIRKRESLEKEGNGIHYRFIALNKSEYIVGVTGWGKIKGKDAYVSFFRYVVDMKNKQVKLTSNRVIKE